MITYKDILYTDTGSWNARTYTDDLYHHGIKGQKWGIRRFQNRDGSLTEAGKQRYSYSPDEQRKINSLNNLSKTLITPGATGGDWSRKAATDPKIKKRLIDAADLGLEALVKTGRLDGNDIDNKSRGSWRSWLLFEDQTMGIGMVADMINQGYSAKQVSKVLSDLSSLPDISNDPSNAALNNAVLEATEGNYKGILDYYARVCEDIKNNKRS